ncbi:MFS transporter [Eubacterium sp.]|uniref:MFS transporter n=1 Tax=Eubacterium sp. TaxID=142586 RepID=UPI0026DF28D7|nr:MFS transporter [Eubacterium sp.]MDO5434074.1 MFS transporter [Eubacterium sp.]
MNRKPIFQKDFILVAIGQIVSLFGNQILRYALPLYLLNETGSSALFGTVMACSFIPMILLFPIGGIIADRVNKRNIMVALDFCTAALTMLFCLLLGKVSIVPLMAVTMIILYGIQGAYQPAVQSCVPELVATEHIMQGNSVVDLISSLASVAGPVIGGVLFSVVGLTPILYVSIGCFLASAVMETFIHMPFERLQSQENILVTGIGDLRESFGFIFNEQPVLWKMPLVFACVNLLLTTLVLIAAPVLITQRLGFEPDTANRLYGFAQGVMAGGSVLGGLLAGVLAKKLKPGSMPFLLAGCALSVGVVGVALQVFAGMAVYTVLVAGSSLLLIFSTLFTVQLMTCLQMLTPRELTGKVISCVMCVCMCTNPVGQFIYGIVFEHVGSRAYLPFYAAALIMLGITLFTHRVFYAAGPLMEGQAEPR